ncbi:MAG: T9SS type A sorting domain-containing protein [Bacteroidales bacterium]|jgi:hypothetical protein|nr:T9SS type A sorting domain-containing protein [Bacteroidales bacterium]
MKKHTTFFAIFLLSGVGAFAQITLTSGKHGLKPGDVQVMHKAEYVEPGLGGAGQIWNFSDLKFYGEEKNIMLDATTVEKYGALPSATVAINTGGDYHGMFRITATENDNVGHFGDDYHIVFKQPHRRMVYPFTYGNYYSSYLSGYGVYGEDETDISGDYSFEADGYGTLILPNDVLRNVLRVKTTLSKYEFARCYYSETQQTKYLYYTDNQRYPVFAVLETMWINFKGDTSWHRSSAVNEFIHNITEKPVAPDVPKMTIDRKEYIHGVYPNPFKEEFKVDFVLEEKTNVAVELYSFEGVKLGEICSRRSLEQGAHEFEYKNSALPSGTYFVKFIFNEHAFVKQIINIK